MPYDTYGRGWRTSSKDDTQGKCIGGVSDAQWGKQFRQQYRVIDPKGLSYAISATAIPIMTPRKV